MLLLLSSAKTIVVEDINNEMLINNFFFQFIKMCVQKSLDQLQSASFEPCNNSDLLSMLKGKNSTYSDGKLYGLEMDVRAGYHMVMSLNSTYDNVSHQRFVSRSVRLDKATRCRAVSSVR